MIARLAAVSLALVLGMSACGSTDDDPSDEPSERPEFAQEAGVAGAERFAGYWVETLNEATDSGDTETYRSLASEDCAACEDFAQQLDTIYESGGRVESKGWEIAKIVPEAGATEDAVGLLMTVDVSEQTVYKTADAKADTFDGGTQAFRLELIREDEAWLVDDLSPR